MEVIAENKNRFIALGLTIGVHALLLLLFFFIVFITPIPPFEEPPVPEIEISLGMEGFGSTDAGGSGKNDYQITTTTQESSPQTSQTEPVDNSAPNIITDPTETSTYIPNNPKNKKQPVTKTAQTEEPKASQQLLNALDIIKNKRNQTGNGQGTGDTGGSGTGSSQGIGSGEGMGHGNGTPGWDGAGNSFDLKGRLLLKTPDQMTDSQEEGVVVVEIIVDENGKVIRATPGQRGTTTTSSNLFAKARQAAYSVKFNPSPQGIKEQRGTYTFVFVLE